MILRPTLPSLPATWNEPEAVAVFAPDGAVPIALGGIPFVPVAHPDARGWTHLGGAGGDDPPPPPADDGRKPAAGAVIVEPDGRVWLIEPTNGFRGYTATFPKGRPDPGQSLRAAAAREVFEETGLLVALGPMLVDVPRSGTNTRFFLARRVGGSPAAMGWETQALRLVPLRLLAAHAEHPNDTPVVTALLVGRVGITA